MVARNSWLLPVAILLLLGVVAIFAFSTGAANLAITAAQPATRILHVPVDYSSIQAAIDAAQAGDIIQIAPGTYIENLTLNKPVTLSAANPDPVDPVNNTTILDGGNGPAAILISAGLSQAPSLHGLVIRNSQYGIDAHSQFVVEDNYFYGSQTSIIYRNGSGGINRSNVYFNSVGDAVDIGDLRAPLLIEDNRFLYAGDDAMEIDFPGTSVPSVVEIDVWNNMLIGSRQDGIKLVDTTTNPRDINRRVMVAGNLIANNRRAGIGFVGSGNTNEDYSAAGAAESVRVYNNTFFGNDYGLSGGSNLVAFNNIIANSTSRGAWKVQGPSGANSIISYTLFWNNGADAEQSFLGPGDILKVDPLFLELPNPGPDGVWGTVDDDFRGLLLQPGSPAIDKGITQYMSASGERIPPTPLRGFLGAAPDLGWRELGSPISFTPTPLLTVVPTGSVTVTPAATDTGSPVPTSTGQPTATLTSPPASSGTPPSLTAAATTTPPTSAPQPITIQGLSPTSAKSTDQLVLTITGTGFQSGAVVSFEGPSEPAPQVLNVQVVDPSTIQATIDVADDAKDIDLWDLRVTNPDGSTARVIGAFTVMP